MKNIKYIIFIICAISHINTFSQALKIADEVELLPTNIQAARNSRIDSNGHPCGILLVHSTIPNLYFKGNIMGDVNYEAGTYSVYLAPGTSKLEVLDSSGAKIILKFPKIVSKATYQTTLVYTDERGYIECFTDPSGATINLISGEERFTLGKTPIRGNVEIKSGTYTLTVSKNGYITKVIYSVKIKPNKTSKLGTIKLKKQ